MRTLYLAALGLLCLPMPLSGQKLEKVTDVSSQGLWATYSIIDYYAYGGSVYTINESATHERMAFATLDIQSGDFTYLPYKGVLNTGDARVTNASRFTESNGMLFARVGGAQQHRVLFRIGGTDVSRLTPPGITPLTDPVTLKGATYFLAADGYAPPSLFRFSELRTVSLYRTDGTPEGTESVARLPHPAESADYSFLENSNWVLPGKDALLLCVQGDRKTTLHLYEPGGQIAHVGLAQGAELADQTTYSQYQLSDKFYDRGPAMPVVYSDGYFYFVESIRQAAHRISEADGSIKAIEDPSGVLRSIPWNGVVSMATTTEGVYVQAYDQMTGEAIVGEVSREESPRLTARLSFSTSIDAAPAGVGDRLYYIGMLQGSMQLVSYDRATTSVRGLFGVQGGSEYKMVLSKDFIYLLPVGSGGNIYRYSLSDRSHTIIATGLQNRDYALLGEGLLYPAYVVEGNKLNTRLHHLPADRVKAVPIVTEENVMLGGIYHAELLGVDSVYHIHNNQDVDQTRQLYDGQRKTNTRLSAHYPGITSERAYFRSLGSHAVIVDEIEDYTSYFTLIDGQPVPLIDDATGQVFRVASGTGRVLFFDHLYWMQYDDGVITPRMFLLKGRRLMETELGDSFRGKYYDPAKEDGILTFFIIDDDDTDNIRLLSVDERSASVLNDREFSSQHYLDLGTSRQGSWLGLHDTLDNAYSIIYFPHGGGGETTITLSGSEAAAGHLNAVAIADRLLFNLPDEAGNQWWVADGETGALSKLAGDRPFADQSADDLFAKALGSIVYYSGIADDGRSVSLWRTDATAEGTYKLGVIDPTTALQYKNEIVMAGDSLIVFPAHGEKGVELYVAYLKEDERIGLISDVNPGAGSSYPQDIIPVDDGIYFTAIAGDQQVRQLFYLSELSTSTRRIEPTVTLNVFPNPAADRISIQVPANMMISSVEVFDNLGRRLLRQSTAGLTPLVEISALPTGLYHLIAHFSDGRRGYNKLTVAR